VPFCRACHAEIPGTVCGWCGRTVDAAETAVSATNQRRMRTKWLIVMGVAVGLPLLGLAIGRGTPSAIRRVSSLPAVKDAIGGRCRWAMSDSSDAGRDGWKVVECQDGATKGGPAFYVDKIGRVFSKNAAAKTATEVPYPPETPAWLRPGVTCSMADYYDDCLAGIVIEKVRVVTGQDLAALQGIADQTLSLRPGRTREVAEKVLSCGGGSSEARCGSFYREMRLVAGEVARQIADQRDRPSDSKR
jgi:hypothetical protein